MDKHIIKYFICSSNNNGCIYKQVSDIRFEHSYGGGTITEKICTICNRIISLNDNPLGLVFEDKHFVCEDCCDKHSKEEISKFTKTVMQSPNSGMPIALWLIHEQNKDKNLMTLRE